MKKTTLLTLLLAVLGVATGRAEFSPEAGKMYALKESTSGLYLDIQTLGINEPNANTTTNNISLNAKPCIIYFEAGADGKWKMRNANGTFVGIGGREWNAVINSTGHEWIFTSVDEYVTISKDATNFIGWDNNSSPTAGMPMYNNAEGGNKTATRLKFSLDDYPKDIQTYYTLKSPTGTYLNFTKVGTTAISFQETPSYLYMIPTANGYVFEDKDNAGQYIGLSTSNNWDAGTGLAVWNVSEADEDGYVTISRFDNSFNLGHDGNTTAGTGIYTNVGNGCYKWLIDRIDKYAGTVPTFTDETSTINSYGQYLTDLKLDETTVLSGLSAPTSAADMYVVAEDKGIVLKAGSVHKFNLTFPKNQTSQILVANIWIDKDGDGTFETHLGTIGTEKSNSNDISTAEFTVPADASKCFTRIRLRLDSSWGIAETADANANRMIYDIPVNIDVAESLTFRLDNTTGEEVEVKYDGNAIKDGDVIENVDVNKFSATDVTAYSWEIVVDVTNGTVTLVYNRTHYIFATDDVAKENSVEVKYGENAIETNGLLEISTLNTELFSATEIPGYTWSIVVDEENCTITLVYTEAPSVENPDAVVALVNRIGGAGTAEKFKFVLDPSLNSKQETFVLGSEEGKILVKGTTISAITTGLGWYLNHIAHINISWNSLNEKTVAVKNEGAAYADLSELPLPTVEETHVSDAKYRYYLNTCTFGYSMTSWTWTRWQQEIDWMALHGINMPLQLVGLEEVWRKFLTMEEGGKRKYGYDDESAKAFVAGPAFIAWWAMNNLEGWGGTGSGTKSGGTWAGAGGVQNDAWYVRQKELAGKITAAQRALGMQPVLPGWSGMVPTNFAEKSGYATRSNGGNWAGDFVRPLLLSVSNADYAEIAADYYECLHAVMGESQYYSMDPFHEGGGAGTMEDYEALYAAMEAAKPGSQWVIQQWQWSNTQKYSLTAVPAGRLIVLDLFSDGSPAFDNYNGYAPQDAVFCAIPNFGGRSGLMGRLQNVTDNYFKFKEKYASIKGIGAAPEAIEQTPVTYDLIFQLPWMNGVKPDVAAWVDNYAIARYGQDNAVVKEAWSLLRQGPLNYGADGIQGPVEDVWAARPNLDANPASAWGKTLNHAGGTYTKARRQMLIDATYKLLSQHEALGLAEGSVYESNYNYDLVEFIGAVMADYAYDLLLGIKEKQKEGMVNPAWQFYLTRREGFLNLLLDVDAFKGTNLNFRLGKWTQEARDAAAEVEGATTATADWYEFNNARTIVSTWSSPGTNLNDYSYRSWQGLIKDLYYPRWKYFFDHECKAGEYQFFEWNWAHGMTHEVGQTTVSTTRLTEGEPGYAYTREPEGNTVEKAKEILDKYIVPLQIGDSTYYAYRHLTNDLTPMITVVAEPGETIDVSPYFISLGQLHVYGDFIDLKDNRGTDLSQIPVRSDIADGVYIATIDLNDGTMLEFAVVINPAYNGVYNINYKDGDKDAPVFVRYNEDKDNSNNVGYKLIAEGTYSADALADKMFTIVPKGAGYSISAQGKYLKQPNLSYWNHLMFSDNAAEAGAYIFEETAELSKIFKIRSTGSGINYVNDYDKLVFGNDNSDKENLATFTLSEVNSYPLTISEAGMATLCLPFNVMLPEGMTAYDFASTNVMEEGEGAYICIMQSIAGSGNTLNAGTPVIVKAEPGDYTLRITMSDRWPISSLPGSLLRGNFTKQELVQGTDVKKFILMNEDPGLGFYRMQESGTIGANKCWMEWTTPEGQAEARSFRIRFEQGETGIVNVESQPTGQYIYNLAGQRLSVPQKGINIIGNKKVIVK
ncbi:MAG: alpha-N-acetylglucosaminidase [Bacteroidaceae bacterium]|nr:alpha-N-acetylglucosaminidase [Bacteroidaceae bacterium]